MFRNKGNSYNSRLLKAAFAAIFLLGLFVPLSPVQADAAGYALYFDGVNDYVDLGRVRDIMPGTEWTNTMSFSVWVKPQGSGSCTANDVAACSSIFGDRPRWWGLSHGTYNGQQGLFAWNTDGVDGSYYDIIRIPYTPDEWVHITWIHANGMLSAYKNGSLVGSIPSGTTLQPPSNENSLFPRMYIGATNRDLDHLWAFNGEVDELRIYNIELTEGEIRGTLFSELMGNEPGLRAYYKMSDGSGITLTDDSINSFNGTLLESEWITNNSLPLWVTSTAFNKPVVNDFSITTNSDTSVAATLLAYGNPSSILTYTTSDPPHGSLTGTAPDLTYIPDPGYFGADSFIYRAWDGSTPSVEAAVTISVNAIPVADNKTINTSVNTPVSVTLTGSDIESPSLTFAVTGGPSHGSLSGSSPNLTYTPSSGYAGADSFTYTAFDGQATSLHATVTINVTSGNVAPVAYDQSLSTNENTDLSILLTGSDPESQPITFFVLTQPQHGNLTGIVPNLTYHPDINYSGADSFTFRVYDGTLYSNAATISITVAAASNLIPIANPQNVDVPEDGSLDIVLSGSDPEGQPLTYAFNTPPAYGSLIGTAPNMTYSPHPNYNGSDFFVFRVSDGVNWSELATVNITVLPVNDAPRGTSAAYAVATNSYLDITLAGTDIDGDLLSFEITVQPQKGTLSAINPTTNVVRYTPDLGYVGADVFRFKVWDGLVWSLAPDASISLNIQASTGVPVANPDSYLVPMNGSLVVNSPGVLLNDVDANTAVLGDNVDYGVLSFQSDGSFNYTPANGFTGVDRFTYYAVGDAGDSNPVSVILTVGQITKVFLPMIMN